MHHWECTMPNVDISLLSEQSWATSIVSSRERLLDFRSCWFVFIHVVWQCRGGLLQFSKGAAAKPVASVLSGICAMCANRENHWLKQLITFTAPDVTQYRVIQLCLVDTSVKPRYCHLASISQIAARFPRLMHAISGQYCWSLMAMHAISLKVASIHPTKQPELTVVMQSYVAWTQHGCQEDPSALPQKIARHPSENRPSLE